MNYQAHNELTFIMDKIKAADELIAKGYGIESNNLVREKYIECMHFKC